VSWIPITPRWTSMVAHEADAGVTAKNTARHMLQAGGLYSGLYFEAVWPMGATHNHAMGAVDTWEQWAGFDSVMGQQGLAAGAQDITIPAAMSGRYHLSAKLEGWVFDADNWQLGLCKNGNLIDGGSTGIFQAWSYNCLSIAADVDCIQGDVLDMRVLFSSLGWVGGMTTLYSYVANFCVRRG
jgi:hypothetical protein